MEFDTTKTTTKELNFGGLLLVAENQDSVPNFLKQFFVFFLYKSLYIPFWYPLPTFYANVQEGLEILSFLFLLLDIGFLVIGNYFLYKHFFLL